MAFIGLAVMLILPTGWGFAQEGQPDPQATETPAVDVPATEGPAATGPAVEGPVYVIQEGDYLWDIALRFGVSMDELIQANGITNANTLGAGTELVIPGIQGVQGTLTTRSLGFGETLRSLSRRYGLSPDTLSRLNHLTSPAELYAGANLILPEDSAGKAASQRAVLLSGQSLIELAASQNVNPWTLALQNGITNTQIILPGDVLMSPAAEGSASQAEVEPPGALPEVIHSVEVKPLPMVQGKATVLRVQAEPGLSLSGALAGRPLTFFPDPQGGYVALQGLHAMLEPGLYSLQITGTLPVERYQGAQFTFSQSVFVKGGDYFWDPTLTVSPETIDPAVTKPEDAEWTALAQPVTPDKLWDGMFSSPVPPPYQDCWPSMFGNRRSYNGGNYDFFHTGLDFCGGVGTEILAPAAGKVIFAGPLTVRGNATMIDHGWGVYSAYMHQSEISVNVGDVVEAGQTIGLVGGTGRVTGPHLHFEIWVGGLQIDPMDWLLQEYP